MSVENTTTEVTSTEFRAHSGQYIEESGKTPRLHHQARPRHARTHRHRRIRAIKGY